MASDHDSASGGGSGWLEDDAVEDAAADGLPAVPGEFTSARDLFQHCATEHSFDFIGLRDRLALDFYESIRLISAFARSTPVARRLMSVSSLAAARFSPTTQFICPPG